MTTFRLHVPITALLLLVMVALAACSQDPQEQYNDATQALQEAREARNDAQDKLKDKQKELSELQANLNETQANLRSARQKVQQASQNVDKTVTDEVLFRTIQREVLNNDDFEDAAISVGVNNRVVTLTGNVPDEDTHKQAIKVTKAQAGVKSVIDNLEVREAQSAPPKDKQSGGNAQQSSDNGGGEG